MNIVNRFSLYNSVPGGLINLVPNPLQRLKHHRTSRCGDRNLRYLHSSDSSSGTLDFDKVPDGIATILTHLNSWGTDDEHIVRPPAICIVEGQVTVRKYLALVFVTVQNYIDAIRGQPVFEFTKVQNTVERLNFLGNGHWLNLMVKGNYSKGARCGYVIES